MRKKPKKQQLVISNWQTIRTILPDEDAQAVLFPCQTLGCKNVGIPAFGFCDPCLQKALSAGIQKSIEAFERRFILSAYGLTEEDMQFVDKAPVKIMFLCKSGNHQWTNKNDAAMCCNGFVRVLVYGGAEMNTGETAYMGWVPFSELITQDFEGPDPNCRNCDGAGGNGPKGTCGLCWGPQ